MSSAGENLIIGIAGRRGSGKSTVLEHIVTDAPRLLLWDLMGEHRWCINPLRNSGDVHEFMRWARDKDRFRARVVPEYQSQGMFDTLCDLAYRRGNLVLTIEEVAMISMPQWVPENLDRIVRLGRHRDVSLVWTTQRLSEVPRRLTSATDCFVLFAHHEPRDIDAIRQRCGIEVGDLVPRLGRHNFVRWNVLSGEITQDSLDGLRF